MKFIIQYGNKWLSQNASVGFSNISEQDWSPQTGLASSSQSVPAGTNQTDKEKTYPQSEHMRPGSALNTFNLQLKKRRLFFEKLKQIGIISSNLYINLLSKIYISMKVMNYVVKLNNYFYVLNSKIFLFFLINS